MELETTGLEEMLGEPVWREERPKGTKEGSGREKSIEPGGFDESLKSSPHVWGQ